LLTLGSGLFSSLAASYFQINLISQPANVIVNVSGRVGLGYANLGTAFLSNNYTPYVAAAGVSSSMFNFNSLITAINLLQSLYNAGQ
jgi:hypothetical protein